MEIQRKAVLCLMLSVFFTACTDREAEARRVKEEADAKAQAAAARKEMEAVPATFKSRDIFKKNASEQKDAVPGVQTVPQKK